MHPALFEAAMRMTEFAPVADQKRDGARSRLK
jgi:hypothetical protein